LERTSSSSSTTLDGVDDPVQAPAQPGSAHASKTTPLSKSSAVREITVDVRARAPAPRHVHGKTGADVPLGVPGESSAICGTSYA